MCFRSGFPSIFERISLKNQNKSQRSEFLAENKYHANWEIQQIVSICDILSLFRLTSKKLWNLMINLKFSIEIDKYSKFPKVERHWLFLWMKITIEGSVCLFNAHQIAGNDRLTEISTRRMQNSNQKKIIHIHLEDGTKRKKNSGN